jgi:NitT/TauT family transport system substrate-binding protein
MRTLRLLPAIAASLALTFGPAQAQTQITVGKVLSGSGFHIPTYVAMDRGFYKEEGLDARFVLLTGAALVKAGLAGNVDFVPIPSGGAQAALSGAEIRFVVGEALKSQWVIVARPEIAKAEDLKGKTVGYGRQGAADYDEGAAVLLRSFKMAPGKDYKVISFPGEAERIAALVNGDIAAGLVSVPHVPKALNAGMKVLLRTGDYIQRAGGTIWVRKAYADQNPEVIKKFIRATAKAVTFFRQDRAGSMPILRNHLGIDNDKDAGIIWDQVHTAFGAEIPADLFREILESRRKTMIAAKQWAADKPLPDPEQFVTRAVLDATLKDMGYVHTKVDAPTN